MLEEAFKGPGVQGLTLSLTVPLFTTILMLEEDPLTGHLNESLQHMLPLYISPINVNE